MRSFKISRCSTQRSVIGWELLGRGHLWARGLGFRTTSCYSIRKLLVLACLMPWKVKGAAVTLRQAEGRAVIAAECALFALPLGSVTVQIAARNLIGRLRPSALRSDPTLRRPGPTKAPPANDTRLLIPAVPRRSSMQPGDLVPHHSPTHARVHGPTSRAVSDTASSLCAPRRHT